MYGYTAKRPGIYITHIINFTVDEYNNMLNHSYCFSDNSKNNWLSFTHLDEKKYLDFINTFNILLVDSKKKLKFLHKLTT